MDQLLTKFKETEIQYNQLKARLGKGEITPDLAKAEIKKMMLQDDTGTYWMMGGKTGKWYKHINNQWQEADPYLELAPPITPEAPVTLETESDNDVVFPLDAYQSDNVFAEAGEGQKIETLGKLSYGDQSDLEVQAESAHQADQDDEYDKYPQYDQYDQADPVDKRDKTDPFGVVSGGMSGFESQQEDSQEEEDAFSLSKYQSDNDSNLDILDEKESDTTMHYDKNSGLDSFDTQSKPYTFATQSTEDDFSSDSNSINFGDSQVDIQDTNSFLTKSDDHYVERETGYGVAIDLDQEEAASDLEGSSMFGGSQDFEESPSSQSSKPLFQSYQEEEETLSPRTPAASAGHVVPPSSPQAQAFSAQAPVTAGAGIPALDLSQYTQCPVCKSKIPPISIYCSFCGANQKELDSNKSRKAQQKKQGKEGESELVIKSIRYFSMFFFLGGIGAIVGVIVGAMYGVLKEFSPLLPFTWPEMISITRGGVWGGVIFAGLGGIGGFFLSALFSFIPSALYNLLAYVFGGLRFRVKG